MPGCGLHPDLVIKVRIDSVVHVDQLDLTGFHDRKYRVIEGAASQRNIRVGLVLLVQMVELLFRPDISGVRECWHRSEEHTSELQSLMRISYAVFCLKKKSNYN